MSYQDDEASAEDNRPVEFFDIVEPTVTYRIASGVRDLIVGLVVYKAEPIARGALVTPRVGASTELELSLPVTHAFVRRWLRAALPPRRVEVTAWRKQLRSGEIKRFWVGNITSIGVDNNVAKFRVVARVGESLLRTVPAVNVSARCPHVLYDTMCKMSRAGVDKNGNALKLATTVMHVSGRDVRVDLTNVPAGDPFRKDFVANGELVHVASGERMTIAEQNDASPGFSTVTVLTLQQQIVGMKVGDAIEVYAGCWLDIKTCSYKFNNRHNHGGQPHLNARGDVQWSWHAKTFED